MSKRSIIVCTIVAVLLLAGIGYLFCTLFFGDSGKTVRTDRLTDGVEAVPSDAVFLLEAGSLSDIADMTDSGSALGRMLGCIPDAAYDWEAALSMHYSSKNTVSPLLVLSIPEDEDAAAFMDRVLGKCAGTVDKRYGQLMVHKAAVPDASFALYGRFLVASPSLVIVEASLRHLESGASIKDEPLYSEISGVTSGRAVLHVNFANLGKLFSGAAAPDYVRYASFFQSFADWGAFGMGEDDSPVTFDGRVMSVQSGARLSDVLLTQRGRKPEVLAVVPHNASYVITLPITSFDDYLKAYTAYIAADGRKKDYDYINASLSGDLSTRAFAASLKISEAAVFSVDMGGERKILALKCGDLTAVGGGGGTVMDWRFKGYIPALLGSVFAPSSEESCCVSNGWLLVGGREEIAEFQSQLSSGQFFSLQDYLSQTPAVDELREISNLSVMINAGRYGARMAGYLKKPYSETVSEMSGTRNFEFITLNMYRTGNALGIRTSVYSEDLASLPQPYGVEDGTAQAVVEDVPVTVPEGPFEVRNFIDGSTNWLEQLSNYDIRLLNSSRRPVWTVKFDKPLCGTVRQIDYLRNNKLQMLFGAGDRIHLLDRLGRTVGRFPISLGKEILLGPDVYDFKGNKDYTLVVLHADNTIVQYDIDGKKVPGWNVISLNERIMSLPERIIVGDRTFWAVRTSYQTLIYDANGTICADFSKKRKLKKDTEIEPVSSHEVGVTTSDGRAMVLDLTDGSFRKR